MRSTLCWVGLRGDTHPQTGRRRAILKQRACIVYYLVAWHVVKDVLGRVRGDSIRGRHRATLKQRACIVYYLVAWHVVTIVLGRDTHLQR